MSIKTLRWPPWPLIGWVISISYELSHVKPLKGIRNKFDRKQDLDVVDQLSVFQANRKTKMAARPLFGWDLFDFPLKPLNRIQPNLPGSKISTSSTKFVFFEPIGKPRSQPRPLTDWDIFTSLLKLLSCMGLKKIDRKQDINGLYQCFDFLPIGKLRRPAWPLTGLGILDFFSEAAEWNSSWQLLLPSFSLS